MTSTIVPPVDLAPGMPSRVVTISATDVTEGGRSLEGQMVRFALSDTLDVSSGGDVIAKTQAEVVLDSNGEGSIRLPVYDEDVRTWCGDPDWAILVTATWGSQKAIRVPAGTSSIALSALPPVRPLRGREKLWAITGASVSITEGASWDASVTLSGGILTLNLTVPPGATAWDRTGTYLTDTDRYQDLDPAVYWVQSGAIATSLGLPVQQLGALIITDDQNSSARTVEFKTVDYTGGAQSTWTIASDHTGSWALSKWKRTEDGYLGTVSAADGPYTSLATGRHAITSATVATGIGLQSPRAGILDLAEGYGGARNMNFVPSHPGNADTAYDLTVSTTPGVTWPDSFYVRKKHRLRSAPIILSQPSGEYTTNDHRPAHRIPFTVPCETERMRIHVRAYHYRTGQSWGGMTIQGMAVGKHLGGGTMNGIQEIPNVAGGWVPQIPGEWWSTDWRDVYLNPGQEYLFSYAADWTDAYPMQLLSCTTWASTDPASYNQSSGGSRFSLQPLEIWLEVLAPSDVPVFAYMGTSLTMGMDSPDPVFNSYPQLHARRHGAFCAMTAAGGWAIVDDSARDAAVIGRLGDAGLSDRAYALWGGANDIGARGATEAEIATAIEDWLITSQPLLGAPDTYLLTNAGGVRYSGPDDPAYVALEEVNDWMRKVALARSDVAGVIDTHALTGVPGAPWSVDPAFVIGPTNGHFNAAGHKRWAEALDAGFAAEQIPAAGVTYLGDGVYELS